MVTALDQQTALVLIDLQQGILQLPTARPVDTIVVHAARLAAAFQQAGLPVVIVRVQPLPPDRPVRNDSGRQPASLPEELLALAPEIPTGPDTIFITKHGWNAFYNTPLHEILQERNVTGIVLAGISTSIGVEGTARSAAERGYNIAFARDAMTDLFAEAHAHSLRYIFPRIGEVDDTAAIIGLLQSRP